MKPTEGVCFTTMTSSRLRSSLALAATIVSIVAGCERPIAATTSPAMPRCCAATHHQSRGRSSVETDGGPECRAPSNT